MSPTHHRLTARVLAAGLALAILAGCSGDSEETSESTSPADLEETGESTAAADSEETGESTAPADQTVQVVSLMDELTSAVNDADMERIKSSFAPDVAVTIVSGSAAPDPDAEPADLDIAMAKVVGTATTWSDLECVPSDVSDGAALCTWAAEPSLVSAAGLPPVITHALVTGSDGIETFHLAAEDTSYVAARDHFLSWLDRMGRGSAAGESTDPTRVLNVESYRVDQEPTFVAYLAEWECAADEECRVTSDVWVGEYEANCGPGENGIRFPSAALYEQMSAMPLPSDMTDVAAQLLARDKTLSSTLGSPGLTNEMITQRRELLSEFGLAETCMGDL